MSPVPHRALSFISPSLGGRLSKDSSIMNLSVTTQPVKLQKVS